MGPLWLSLCIMYLDTYQIAAACDKSITALLSQNSVAFSSRKGERAKRERVCKSPHENEETRWGERKMTTVRLAFLAWGDFHARSRFARSTIPEEKWRLLVVYGPTHAYAMLTPTGTG